MKNLPPLAPAPDRKATVAGLAYWIFSNTLLGTVIYLAAALFGVAITQAQLNILYFAINFLAAVIIFRKFLLQNWRAAIERFFPTVYYAILAYLGTQALTTLVTLVICRIYPDFLNVNDQSIHTLIAQQPALMVIGTVLLAPVAEEIFYRGMLFRKLFDRRPWLGYVVSILVFSAVHMAGYIGTQPPILLLLGLLQYVPAGYCLCWCYRQTGTILSPILMHIMFNAASIIQFVR